MHKVIQSATVRSRSEAQRLGHRVAAGRAVVRRDGGRPDEGFNLLGQPSAATPSIRCLPLAEAGLVPAIPVYTCRLALDDAVGQVDEPEVPRFRFRLMRRCCHSLPESVGPRAGCYQVPCYQVPETAVHVACARCCSFHVRLAAERANGGGKLLRYRCLEDCGVGRTMNSDVPHRSIASQ
jgi:hypothetical protein